MTRQIFISLPVRDLKKSRAFYAAVGATNNPQFTDDSAAGMSFSDAIIVMLMTHEKWAQFTPKPIADAATANEVMLSLSCESRQAVDAMTEAAAAHGGRADIAPTDDYPFMYGRNFEDPDGHVWAPTYLDMSKFPKPA